MKKIRILSLILTMILMLSVFCMPKASASTYSITVTITAGSSNGNRAAFYTTGAATVTSTSLTSGSDPALYNSAGTCVADDEAGNSHFKYTTTSGTNFYAGTYGNGAAKYTITSTAPITLIRNGCAYSAAVTMTAGSNKVNRAVFKTSNTAIVESWDVTLGIDPVLYLGNGSKIADDEAGSLNWRYVTSPGAEYFAGTYGNWAAAYTIYSTQPITLIRSGCAYSVNVTVRAGAGAPNRIAFKTTGAATVESADYAVSGYDPSLYNSAGTRLADDEAGNKHFRYNTASGTYYYAGTFGNTAATYTIYSTAPIALVEFYRIKHVQSGKYLNVLTSGTNQYGLTLSTLSTSSNYQKWKFLPDLNPGVYSIQNGGYATRYLLRDTTNPIYFLGKVDGYKSTTGNEMIMRITHTGSNVYITSTDSKWSLETNHGGSISPHFYDNTFGGSSDFTLNQWKLEPV